jgi:hypothetical protein
MPRNHRTDTAAHQVLACKRQFLLLIFISTDVSAFCFGQVDGSSYVVHSEEEAMGTRLTIGSQTCLLSNEHDPSKARLPF